VRTPAKGDTDISIKYQSYQIPSCLPHLKFTIISLSIAIGRMRRMDAVSPGHPRSSINWQKLGVR
jgi:hypothetical protein